MELSKGKSFFAIVCICVIWLDLWFSWSHQSEIANNILKRERFSTSYASPLLAWMSLETEEYVGQQVLDFVKQ